MAEAVLLEKAPATLLAHRCQCTPAIVRRRLRQVCKRIVAAPPAPAVPDGDLVLLIDGIWSTLRGQCWVLYNLALKPTSASRAWFLDPYLECGRESVRGWQAALATIPPPLVARIRALVTDGLPGVDCLAASHGWLLQLCHRHLLAGLRQKLGRYRQGWTIQQPGRGILASVQEALVTADEDHAAALGEEIVRLSRHPNCTLRLRWTAQYFIRQMSFYRTYRQHPELALPITTSAVESIHRQLRRVISTVNDPGSMKLRVTAYLRLRQTVTCNPAVLKQKL